MAKNKKIFDVFIREKPAKSFFKPLAFKRSQKNAFKVDLKLVEGIIFFKFHPRCSAKSCP